MASRSTAWTITNATKSDWNLTTANIDHGVWASNPPAVVKAGKTITFNAESDGFATGDEGTVTYNSADGSSFIFYFNNPFLGTDGYKVTCPNGYDHKTAQTTGTDQVLTTRCFQTA